VLRKYAVELTTFSTSIGCLLHEAMFELPLYVPNVNRFLLYMLNLALNVQLYDSLCTFTVLTLSFSAMIRKT